MITQETMAAPAAVSAKARTELAIDLLSSAERRLLKVVGTAASEGIVNEIAAVLRDLSMVRMNMELPIGTDKRSSARIQEHAAVCLTLKGGQKYEAVLHDISGGGALVECDDDIRVGEHCSLELPGLDGAVRGVVRFARAGLTHIAFEDLPVTEVIAILKHIERRYLRY